MGRHRLKMADFLELGMKTSREKSSGGTASGDWGQARAWEVVDRMCVDAMNERFAELDIKDSEYATAMVLELEDVSADSTRVVFDVAGTGLVFEPGDRVHILPKNSPLEVLRNLKALDASGSYEVKLSETWLSFVQKVGLPDAIHHRSLPLHDFLCYAEIRPVTRSVALHVLELMQVQNASLQNLIESSRELDGFEFWDFVCLCKRLCPHHSTNKLLSQLGMVLPPLTDRQYSISSASTNPCARVEIVVGQLWYAEEEPDQKPKSLAKHRWDQIQTVATCVTADKFKSVMCLDTLRKENSVTVPERTVLSEEERLGRAGTCSTYLRMYALGTPVLIRVESADHFHVPTNRKMPVVMFALGTGVAPFRSFVQSLANKCELWLFWGVPSNDDLFCWKEWAQLIVDGTLNMRIAFSRKLKPLGTDHWPDEPSEAEAQIRWNTLTAGMQHPGRLGQLLSELHVQTALASLVDQGATFYACGQPALCMTMRTGIVHALKSTGMTSEAAQQKYYELIGERRIREDLFTSDALSVYRKKKPTEILRSHVARHHHTTDCWVVFDGYVYDLTQFLMEHPGGPKILLDKAGRDCTADFDRAHGLQNSRVRGMFAPYLLGPVISSCDKKTAYMNVVLRLVDQLLEASNVLRADWNRFPGLSRCLPPDQTSFYRDREVHKRFTTVTVPLVLRVLSEALHDVHATKSPSKTSFRILKVVSEVRRHYKFDSEIADVWTEAQSAIEALSSVQMPQDAEQLATAIEADSGWLAQARDGSIDLLEELETHPMSGEVVTSRLLGLFRRLAGMCMGDTWCSHADTGLVSAGQCA
eukprot:gnl/TRDRNA2_/TRDRNA2_169248_c1_seq1.p1 gnl/TRDRNA2_/TRDRNA2_169248_c1~~gnl/TRDRNA2_/TRDRNA2_169248_c1_seq1.p1  ORF type:complete len:911 (+),score=115.94 gnl/TRDRNA2_/TRDRNA2_169248_c1_seq1:291-2735(+)